MKASSADKKSVKLTTILSILFRFQPSLYIGGYFARLHFLDFEQNRLQKASWHMKVASYRIK